MNMPFGRYRGREISEVPTDYLEWLVTSELRRWLRDLVERELRRREDEDTAVGAATSLARLDVSVALQLIDAGRRGLANRHHPDRGGDVEVMQAINATADMLRAWLASRAA